MQHSKLPTDTRIFLPEIQEQIDLLKKRFLSILSPEDTNTYSIIDFAGMMLKKFPVVKLTAEEICHQAYLRGDKRVREGLVISNHAAWFKKVIFNIIREECRQELKARDLEQSYWNYLLEQRKTNKNNSGIDIDKINQLYASLRALDKKERHLLNLKIVKGMSYQEIGNYLVEWGEEQKNDEQLQLRLRKQVSRAKNKLRTNFIKNNNYSPV